MTECRECSPWVLRCVHWGDATVTMYGPDRYDPLCDDCRWLGEGNRRPYVVTKATSEMRTCATCGSRWFARVVGNYHDTEAEALEAFHRLEQELLERV